MMLRNYSTPWNNRKAGVYGQKAAGFAKKAAGYE
jgi:hypothetical protein